MIKNQESTLKQKEMQASKQMTQEEIEFYSKKFQFSYSSLSKLMWNPMVFYQMYVMNVREERTDAHLINGKVIHSLLLEEELFNDHYIVSPSNLPSGPIKTVVDRVFHHHTQLDDATRRQQFTDYDNAVIDVMVDINYYQNLKTDQQRLDKIFTAEAISYFNFLSIKGNKTIIDAATHEFCLNAVEIIKSNPRILKLLGQDASMFDSIDIINEQLIAMDTYQNYKFGLKGIIDNLVINHDEKIIYINDIKTTGKDLKDFKESIEYWNYWLQGAMYHTLVSNIYKDLIDQGYKIEFRFIVIDKNYHCYDFYVSLPTMQQWLDRFDDLLKTAAWHYEENTYGLPHDFHHGLVIL